MAKLVGFGKYNAMGASDVLEHGFASRRDALAATATSMGGSQDGYWVVSDARWDFMFLWDMPDATLPAVQNLYLLAASSDRFFSADSFWLLDPVDVDDARSSLPGYRPPGS